MFVMLLITNLAIGHQVQVLDQYPSFARCEKVVPAMQRRIGKQADVTCIPTHR